MTKHISLLSAASLIFVDDNLIRIALHLEMCSFKASYTKAWGKRRGADFQVFVVGRASVLMASVLASISESTLLTGMTGKPSKFRITAWETSQACCLLLC